MLNPLCLSRLWMIWMPKLSEIIAPSFKYVHSQIKHDQCTHIWLPGGRGSCKSSFVGIEIPLCIMRDAEHGLMTHAAVLRRYGVTLRESVYAQLMWGIHMLGVSHLWQASVSPMALTYTPTGQKILFRGADDPMKVKSIKAERGYIKYVWYEEANEFEGEEKIRSINQSLMRGGPTFFAFYTYNPPKSTRNWCNQYVSLPHPETIVHRTDYRSVPPEWLGEQFLHEAEYLKEIDERAYQHEYLGIPVGTGGNVFENLDIRELTDDEVSTFDRICNGVDWGYFPDPWAFNRCHYDAARRTLYIFDELTRNKLGNQETADLLLKKGFTREDRIVADSAEPKSVADYKKFGLHCTGAIKGPGSVEYSMKWLQSLKSIVIDPKRCPDTCEEFMEYEYERTKDGDIISGYPDRDNHHIDAVRYATEPIWRRPGQPAKKNYMPLYARR